MLYIEGVFPLKGGDFTEAGAASKELRAQLAELGVTPDIIRRAAIAAFEAEMNVIIHAVAGNLYYRVEGNVLRITVTDMGPGIENIELAMREGFTTAPEWAKEMGWGSGMGLPNIMRNCDSLNIDSAVGEGTTLDISINLKGNSKPL